MYVFSAEMPFTEAANAWLDSRLIAPVPGTRSARYIRQNTENSYREYIKTLGLFFGQTRLCDIRYQDFGRYQKARIEGSEPFVRRRRPHEEPAPCPCKPKKVNQELGLLISLMKRASAWTSVHEECYERLLVDEDEVIPRALTPDQQHHWLYTAGLQPRWNLVYWYSVVAFGTCMSTDELRGLRVGDINLQHRVLTIPRQSAKNKYRARTIELVGADVLWAFQQLLQRAHSLGSIEPQHYLFPFRRGQSPWDPASPMTSSGIKRLWEEVRNASKLIWFRQYDCRHTAVTRLAEAGTPVDVIMSMAGHVSEKMRQHYTHISRSAQRRWVEQAQYRNPTEPRRQPRPVASPPMLELPAPAETGPRRPISLTSGFYLTSSTW